MKRLILLIATVFATAWLILRCAYALSSGGFVSQDKNELTGAISYRYVLHAKNNGYFLDVDCGPSGHISYSLCDIDPIGRIRCVLDFRYKFDNEQIESRKYDPHSADGDYTQYQRFLQKMIQHDKLVIEVYSLFTPVFDIRDFREKYRGFSHQCVIGQ